MQNYALPTIFGTDSINERLENKMKGKRIKSEIKFKFRPTRGSQFTS